MAGVVGGITRLFQPTVGVLAAENTCKGLNPWYFLVGLHLVSVFFAYGPWDAVKSDLVCHWPSGTGDEKTFCHTLCYNQRFPVAISSAWALHLLAVLIVVALMKFVYVTVKKKDSSGNDVETTVEPMPDQGTSAECGWCDLNRKDEFGGWRYSIYMLCIVMILVATSIFMLVLLRYQLPAVMQKTFVCAPDNAACPASVQCAFTGRSDKQAILWAMACCSVATISLCVGYLATHTCQACGFCRARDGTKQAGAGRQSPEVERGDCHPCGRDCDFLQGGTGGGAGGPARQEDGGSGLPGGRSQLEGADRCRCHGYGSGRDAACGCYENRDWPCYFQESDIEPSLNSGATKEESEGKLLRGDTEVVGEWKEWRVHEQKMPRREPLKTGAKRGRGGRGGGGGGGKAVKYMAKYQVGGKQKV